MEKFPKNLLKAKYAVLSPSDDENIVELSISFQDFELNGENHHSITIDASLENVLPSAYLKEVADLDWQFSPQENGWLDDNAETPERNIEASVYLFGRHQVVQISSMKFARNRNNNGLTLIVKGILHFQYEGNSPYADTDFTLNMPVYSSAI